MRKPEAGNAPWNYKNIFADILSIRYHVPIPIHVKGCQVKFFLILDLKKYF